MINDKEKNFISIIAYVHNEEKNLCVFFDTVLAGIDRHFDKYEVIFVNDASTDRSMEIIRERTASLGDSHIISIINMSDYQGIERAMNAGMDLAIGDYVYEFEKLIVDYNSSLIFSIYEKMLEGFDIVGAVPKHAAHRTSKMFYTLYNLGGGTNLRETATGVFSNYFKKSN